MSNVNLTGSPRPPWPSRKLTVATLWTIYSMLLLPFKGSYYEKLIFFFFLKTLFNFLCSDTPTRCTFFVRQEADEYSKASPTATATVEQPANHKAVGWCSHG